MKKASRIFGAVCATAILATALGSVPAVATHNEDSHRNAKKLIRRPIEIDSRRPDAGVRARGSDLAFQGRLMVAGTYEGTSLFRMRRRNPELKQIGFHDCPGSQGDVSIWKDVVFVSIDSPSSNNVRTKRCNNTRTRGPKELRSANSLEQEGIRVVDISNRRNPRQVGFVETVCGSHTHTLVPGARYVYMYVQSYPLGAPSGPCNQVEFRQFSILRFPKKNPSNLQFFGIGPIPNVFDDPLPPHLPTIGCHDSTSFPRKDIAVSACISNSMILDISRPGKPKILSVIDNPSIEVHHTAAITWDGDYAIISDEHAGAAGGGGCEGGKDGLVGEMWFYNITNRATPFTQPDWHYQLPRQPAADTPGEAERYRCTTHNYNMIPMRKKGRYIAVSAYYTGGWSMVNFSDPSNPKEMAHYLPQVGGALPDMWSTYWYNGRIYSNEHATRFGVGAFKKKGGLNARSFRRRLNPQTQMGLAPPVLKSGVCRGFKRNSRTDRGAGSGKVIVGTRGSDVLNGTPADDIICGLGGKDIIDGNGGQDEIVGNGAGDTITGGGKKDSVRGGSGRDAVDGGTRNDVILGGAGHDALRGNRGWDTLRGEGGRDTLQGGRANDTLRGGARGDTLEGFLGDDVLDGDRGTDTCDGGAGSDVERNCER